MFTAGSCSTSQPGMNSTQAVSRLKRIFNAKKAGHAGTLDPLATGILPVAFGEATKTVPFVQDGEKAYRFTVRWGTETDTDDADGRIAAQSDARPAASRNCRVVAAVHRDDPAIAAFLFGDQDQWRARLRSRPRWRGASFVAARGDNPRARTHELLGPTRRSLRRAAAREPMSARSPAISAEALAVTAMSAPCGGPASGHFMKSDAVPLPDLDDAAISARALRRVEAGLMEVPRVVVDSGAAAQTPAWSAGALARPGRAL